MQIESASRMQMVCLQKQAPSHCFARSHFLGSVLPPSTVKVVCLILLALVNVRFIHKEQLKKEITRK